MELFISSVIVFLDLRLKLNNMDIFDIYADHLDFAYSLAAGFKSG